MMRRNLLLLLLAFGLLCAVYLPAFVVAGVIRPPIEFMIPLVMAISVAMALLLVLFLARNGPGFRAFGFNAPQWREVGFGFLLALPLALAAVGLSRLFPSKPPFDVSRFPVWMIGLYFVVAAPIQEEVIFRGLIQSFLQQRWQFSSAMGATFLSPAVVCTAILFGLVHLDSGPAVVAGAAVLALLAGELRRFSNSLVPAIMVHALFNLTDALWPAAQL